MLPPPCRTTFSYYFYRAMIKNKNSLRQPASFFRQKASLYWQFLYRQIGRLYYLPRHHFLKRYFLYPLSAFILIFLLLDTIFPCHINYSYSQLILDRKGNLIHAFLTDDDKWRMKIERDEITPELRNAFLYKEDRWFYWHFGINPFAICRAAVNNVLHQKRTSGASTITMQVARLLQPKTRNYANKLVEMFRAVQLEWHFSKGEILQMYLNLAPYGGNIEGVKSASVLFWGKSPQALSLAEIAALTVIPNRPNSLRPDGNADDLRQMRNKWLQAFGQAGVFKKEDVADALEEPLSIKRREAPKIAPHFAMRMRNVYPQTPIIKTTLDLGMQQQVQQLTYNYIRRLYYQHIRNAAVLVVNNRTRQVEAYVGSADFSNADDGGQVDGIMAYRSPGSTLKPLLTAAAFDKGLLTPKMKITDVPTNFMGYSPLNYDKHCNGFITVEYALGFSLNIPFVKILNKYGISNFTKQLSDAGFSLFKDPKRKYGLSLILGGCGVRLDELTNLYATFANTGRYRPLQWTNTPDNSNNNNTAAAAAQNETTADTDSTHLDEVQILSPQASYVLTQMLTQLARPDLPKNIDNIKDLPRVAWKTGTSYGRRDAWSMGYNANYTVGVWVGNFSGEGVPDLNGAATATPLLFDVFNTIDNSRRYDWFFPPKGLEYRWVCSETGLIPSDFCSNQLMDFYLPGISSNERCTHLREVSVSPNEQISYCTSCLPASGYKRKMYNNYPPELITFYEKEHVIYDKVPPHNPNCSRIFDGTAPRITSPVNGLDYLIDRADNAELSLVCQISNEVKLVHWYINDRYYKSADGSEKLFFVPKAGVNKITCVDDKGQKSEISIMVKFL